MMLKIAALAPTPIATVKMANGRGQRRCPDQPECVPEIVQHRTTLIRDHGAPINRYVPYSVIVA